MLGVEGGTGTGPGAVTEVRTPRAVATPTPPADQPDSAVVLAAVRSATSGFETCVTQGLKRDPRLDGRVSVGWTVRDGRVIEASVVDNDTGDPAIGDCFARNVRAMRFPAGFSARVD